GGGGAGGGLCWSRYDARSCGPPCGRKLYWAWLCSSAGSRSHPAHSYAADSVKTGGGEHVAATTGAYNGGAVERQRLAPRKGRGGAKGAAPPVPAAPRGPGPAPAPSPPAGGVLLPAPRVRRPR